MVNYFKDTDFQIGKTVQTMTTLRRLNIPVPDVAPFAPASTYYVRGDMTRVGDGFASVTWTWDVISLTRLSQLLLILNSKDYAEVYIKTSRSDGTFISPKHAFAIFKAVMWKPILAGQEGSPVARSPYAMQTVSVPFRRLELQAEYL